MSPDAQSEHQSFDEYAAVEAALRPYVESPSNGDAEAQRSVWMDHARIVGSIDGQFAALTVDEFINAVKEQGPAPTSATASSISKSPGALPPLRLNSRIGTATGSPISLS